MTHEQLVQKIESLLQDMRPYIQGDGGDIELISFQNGIVSLKLHGACESCPMSIYTLKLGIEEHLKAHMPEVSEVIAVN